MTGHSPVESLPGTGWENNGDVVTFPVPSIAGNVLAVQGYTSALIDISSNGPYTKPLQMTLSATIAPNNSGSGFTGLTRGAGLGFFASTSPYYSNDNFTGLSLWEDGTLALYSVNTVLGSAAYTLGTFDKTAFYTITCTIDISTGQPTSGQIFDISLSNGISTQTYNFGTGAYFGDSNTKYAGVFGLVGGNAVYVDNFSLTTIPEPSSLALMALFGCGAFVWRQRELRFAQSRNSKRICS